VHHRTLRANGIGESPLAGQRDVCFDGVTECGEQVDQVELSPGQPNFVVDEQHPNGHRTPLVRRN
jgi:hypothetical protein